MEKRKAEGRGSRSVTGTYEIMGVSKVVTEGARGEFHNFRDVPKIEILIPSLKFSSLYIPVS